MKDSTDQSVGLEQGARRIPQLVSVLKSNDPDIQTLEHRADVVEERLNYHLNELRQGNRKALESVKDIAEVVGRIEVRMASLETLAQHHENILRGSPDKPGGLVTDVLVSNQAIERMEASMGEIAKTLKEIQKSMTMVHGAWIALTTIAAILWAIFTHVK